MENIIKQIEEQKKLIEDIKDHNAFDDLDDWISEEEKKLAELEHHKTEAIESKEI